MSVCHSMHSQLWIKCHEILQPQKCHPMIHVNLSYWGGLVWEWGMQWVVWEWDWVWGCMYYRLLLADWRSGKGVCSSAGDATELLRALGSFIWSSCSNRERSASRWWMCLSIWGGCTSNADIILYMCAHRSGFLQGAQIDMWCVLYLCWED